MIVIFDSFLQVMNIANVVKELAEGTISWQEAEGIYPKFEQQETTK